MVTERFRESVCRAVALDRLNGKRNLGIAAGAR